MKRCLIVLSILAVCGVPLAERGTPFTMSVMAAQAPSYELACPAPYVPLFYATSLDVATGSYRAYGCINESNGQVLWQPDNVTITTNGGTITAPGNITPLVVNTGGGSGEIATVLGDLEISGFEASGKLPTGTLTRTGVSAGKTVEYAIYEYSGTDGAFGRSQPVTLSTSQGPSALNNVNSLTIAGSCVTKYDTIHIQRIINTGLPSSTGFIGSPQSCASGNFSLTDNGLAGDGSPFHSGDVSGLVRAAGLVSRNSPYVGFFTPDSGTVTNGAGIGTFVADSNNPFTSLFSCVSTGCTMGTGTLDVPSNALRLGAARSVGLSGSNSGHILYVGNGTNGDTTGAIEAGEMMVATQASGTAANTNSTGVITLSGGSGSQNFTGTFTTAPVCIVQDESNNTVTKTVTTTSLSVTGTGTDNIDYVCYFRN